MASFSNETMGLIQNASSKILMFAVLRNERLRLEAWIDHYRKMGIRHFFIVDNGSTDGSYEFLVKQPDVVIERTQESFQSAHYGVRWLNEFREIAGEDHWIQFADADELIVYEGWPARPIGELVDRAQARGCDAIYGFMLDMYPEGPIGSCPSEDIENLFSIAPCFDSDYEFKFLPKKPWERTRNRVISVIGGPRVRLLSSMERESSISWFDLFIRGQIDRVLPFVPANLVPTVVGALPKSMPALTKVPLTKGGSSLKYINNHQVSDAKFYEQNVVLCHFKFLNDFFHRAKDEAVRGEHYRRGAEYILYDNLCRTAGLSLDCRYAGTRRFKSSEQLVRLGLIRVMSFSE